MFARPFAVPGFDEELPAGEYDLEIEVAPPSNHPQPESWRAAVLVHLHARESHPGLVRTLTLSLSDLEAATARAAPSLHERTQVFIEEMLADPMVRLTMQADGVSERELRALYERYPPTTTAQG